MLKEHPSLKQDALERGIGYDIAACVPREPNLVGDFNNRASL
jgi:hypothetical protein